MPRPDASAHTPESLTTIALALQAIAVRLTRTAESMKEKGIASLEVKNQSVLKSGITALRSYSMGAEEAFEEWVFDQHLFPENGAAEPARARGEGAARKSKKPPVAEPQPEEIPD